MARRVFFSFHYQKDIWRVNQVRLSYITHNREVAGYYDASLWEKTEQNGPVAIRRLIDDGLINTSVTAVLIGSETFGREWVEYEITESFRRGNGLLGVYIHSLKDKNGYSASKGRNPFENIYYTDNFGRAVYFSQVYPTYDWVANDGYHNFGAWVEEAARRAGR